MSAESAAGCWRLLGQEKAAQTAHTSEGGQHIQIVELSPGIVMPPPATDEPAGPRGAGYRRMIEGSVAGRAGTPDEGGAVAALSE